MGLWKTVLKLEETKFSLSTRILIKELLVIAVCYDCNFLKKTSPQIWDTYLPDKNVSAKDMAETYKLLKLLRIIYQKRNSEAVKLGLIYLINPSEFNRLYFEGIIYDY